ncbi:MAG: MATE family efflux transporter [Erysipelotrichaceae bacterium]|nr:MATE family efflux transporter [Erysipelotrichaceae bacterium]
MQNMTEGSLFSHLWRYALPLLLANWLQLAYNAADSMIAGRFIGQDALAAEGIAAPVMNLVILAISGLCIGAGIFMSERFGAKDMSSFRKSLSAVLKAGIILSLIIAVPGFLLTPLILRLLAVPEDIFRITTIYQRITFIGVPFTFIYNALASAMKSVGDSRRPLRFLAVCSVLNIVLDLILLGGFHLGITTSALTTVFAQVFSAFLAARCMLKEMPDLIPHNEEWKTDTALLKRVMNYGLPSALQQAVQPIGKLLIQSQVNLLGVSTIAAFNAVSRVDSFALIPEQGIASAISTCIAQNRGANKPERIRKGFFTGIAMAFCYGILIGIIVMIFKSQIVSLFIRGNGTAEVIREGTAYLSVMAWIYFLPAFTNGFQGYCRGVGKIPVTIFCTFIQISLRTIGTFLLASRTGIRGIAAASGIGWTAMLLFEVPYVLNHMKHLKQSAR